ncbi:MAG: sulfite exporter TauE/SafE family protein [Alphaproteobacteria bacterium]|nr:sulfite exporter TauE/SafE family protein [Alphaproteobacteria bacterium]
MNKLPPQKPIPAKPLWLVRLTACVAATLLVGLGGVWMAAPELTLTTGEGIFLYLVGFGAATIANSSGVGGGVVFLPAFEYLSNGGHVAVALSQIVGMSFVIQSFGMTTGSLRWLSRIFDHAHTDTGIPPHTFWRLLALVVGCSVPALLATQALHTSPPEFVLYTFKATSVGLGLLVLITTYLAHGRITERSTPTPMDYSVLAALSLVGGVATAFFSVGVGELVALYMFMRSFPLITTAAIAVIASAINVIAGVWTHLHGAPLPWDVLLFVIPGAITGGYFARHFAYMLGPIRLKVFAAIWITLSSTYLLLMS